MKINAWKKFACALCLEWQQKESITKWLQKQSIKQWQRLTKIDLTKKLPFSSTFQEGGFLLGTDQSRPLSVEQIVSEFSEQPAQVITERDDKNEDEESDEQIAEEMKLTRQSKLWIDYVCS